MISISGSLRLRMVNAGKIGMMRVDVKCRRLSYTKLVLSFP